MLSWPFSGPHFYREEYEGLRDRGLVIWLYAKFVAEVFFWKIKQSDVPFSAGCAILKEKTAIAIRETVYFTSLSVVYMHGLS